MQALLISDLHLSPERPVVTEAFKKFLSQQASRAESLFILGDLFEAWIGDDDPAPLAGEVKAAIKTLTDRGVKVFFQQGNRDFLIGKRFARETGCTLLPDFYVTRFNGVKTLLLHGDLLCTEDTEYQRYRRRVRHPASRWLLSHLPLKRRQKIAAQWRAKSMAANANKPENILDVTGEAVEKAFAEFNVSRMIHGHTHRPGVHSHPQGKRLVLGDWHDRGWYISTAGDELSLNEFPF